MRNLLTTSLLLIAAVTLNGAVTGFVTTPDGKPLRNATVYVHEAKPKVGVSVVCPSCYRDCGKHVLTSADGGFQLASLDNTLVFRLLTVAEGYEPQYADNVDPAAKSVRIALTPRAAADADRVVTGIVKDPHGHALSGAVVEPHGLHTVRRAPDGTIRSKSIGFGKLPGLDLIAVTDEQGRFSLRMPDPTDSLDVMANARGLAPSIARNLAPGTPAEITMTNGVAATGKVARDGKPLAGVRVVFEHEDRRAEYFLGKSEVGTDHDGKFLMTNLAPEQSFNVYVAMDEIPGGAVEPHAVHTGKDGSTVDAGTLVVGSGRRVAGRVIVPEGFAIPPHTKIMLDTEHCGWKSIDLPADGRFSFEHTPNDPGRVLVSLPGLRGARGRNSQADSFPAAGDVTNLELEFLRK